MSIKEWAAECHVQVFPWETKILDLSHNLRMFLGSVNKTIFKEVLSGIHVLISFIREFETCFKAGLSV